MKSNEFNFGKWNIIINEKHIQVNNIDEEYGLSRPGSTIEEAAINCIEAVWTWIGVGNLEQAADLASAMVMLGIIPSNIRITETSAIIDGVWYFAYGDDMYPDKTKLNRWYDFEYHNLSDLSFTAKGTQLAKEIIKAAEEEAKDFAAAYDEYEELLMDGVYA